MEKKEHYFTKMIRHLRETEEVMLYGYLMNIPSQEADQVKTFLQDQYQQERLAYPYQPPAYHPDAAVWAAKVCYRAAQLLLYRENEEKDLPGLFPAFSMPRDAAAMLSADLCLRFLPDILDKLQTIDPDDPLVEILEKILYRWHYSAVNYALDVEQLDFAPVLEQDSLRQLYCDRIIFYRNKKLALHPELNTYVRASVGDYSAVFWNDLNITR